MLDKKTKDLDAIDATILAEVGRLHEELSTGQQDSRVLERWRHELLERKGALGDLASATKDLIDARKIPVQLRDWQEIFQLAEEARPIASPRRRLRCLGAITAIWGPEVVYHYNLKAQPKRQLELLRTCARNEPLFDEFAQLTNIVMLQRHEDSFFDNRIPAINSDQRFPPTLADLTAVKSLTLGTAVQRRGRTLQPGCMRDADEVAWVDRWVTDRSGALLVRGHALRELRPEHYENFYVYRDPHGLLGVLPETLLPTKRKTDVSDGPKSKTSRKDKGSPRSELAAREDCSASRLPPPSPKPSPKPSPPSDSSGPLRSLAQPSPLPPSPPSAQNQSASGVQLIQGALGQEKPWQGEAQANGEPSTQAQSRPLHPVQSPTDIEQPVPSLEIPSHKTAGPRPPTPPETPAVARAEHVMTTSLHEPHHQKPAISDNSVDGDRWDQLIEEAAQGQDIDEWIKPLRHASIIHVTRAECTPTQADQTYDVMQLDWDTFKAFAKQRTVFTTPLIIKEAFADSGDYSKEAFADILESSFPGGLINVKREFVGDPEATRTAKVVRMIRTKSKMWNRSNLLDLENLTNAIKPGLTRLPRFRLLNFIIHELKANFTSQTGKQTVLTPFDVGSSESFEIFGFQGAFSGPHLDVLGGTWVRNLFGTKLWMIVPESTMTEDDWADLSLNGPVWDPKGKARAIILEAGDVLFMPPGIKVVHAVLTLETCLMTGGMLWDELTVLPTLRALLWVYKNQSATNEAMPYQFREVLDVLERRLLCLSTDENTSDIRKAISDLRALGCQCLPCDSACPCYVGERRCTPLCYQHTLETIPQCMTDPHAHKQATSIQDPSGFDSEDEGSDYQP